MIYVFGSRLYGKVDCVKGLFHVATKFGHFDYFPLFPMESWLIVSKTGNGWRGVRIPISVKSIFMGWLRAISLLAVIFSAILLIAEFNQPGSAAIPARVLPSGQVIAGRAATGLGSELPIHAAIIATSLFFLIGSRFVPGLGKASPRRTEELGRLLGLSEESLTAIRRKQFDLPPSSGFEVLPAGTIQNAAAVESR